MGKRQFKKVDSINWELFYCTTLSVHKNSFHNGYFQIFTITWELVSIFGDTFLYCSFAEVRRSQLGNLKLLIICYSLKSIIIFNMKCSILVKLYDKQNKTFFRIICTSQMKNKILHSPNSIFVAIFRFQQIKTQSRWNFFKKKKIIQNYTSCLQFYLTSTIIIKVWVTWIKNI